jgi:uncharacterized repeat protein (TIGR03803 family)
MRLENGAPAVIRALALVLILSMTTTATPVLAQYTINTLATFNKTGDGAYPYSGLLLSGGLLYGTASNSGPSGWGTVYSVPVTGGTPSVLGPFNSLDGALPVSDLTLIGDTLFSTTQEGGTLGDYGTVFSLPLTGGTPNAITQFNNSNGCFAEGPLTLSADGTTFYGTTTMGGDLSANNYGYGVVYSSPVAGGTPTVLTSFNLTNGNAPMGGLLRIGNTLYGTTQSGGGNNQGEVFSLPVTGGSPTILTSFDGTHGAAPTGSLIVSGGLLYGTTSQGGNGYGTVFSLPLTGGTPTVLASFNFTDGDGPSASLILSGDTLYGTTEFGADNNSDGEVFSLPLTGGTPTVLAAFDGTDGSEPYGDLLLSDNTLYGTTIYGGYGYDGDYRTGDGTVFSIALPEPRFDSLLVLAGTGLLLRRKRNAVNSEQKIHESISRPVESG